MLQKLSIALIISFCLTACTASPLRPTPGQELPACGSFPNCVNSQSGTAAHAVTPLSGTAQQWAALKRWISQQDDWQVTVDDEYFVQAVVVTPLMRYRDDVQLLYQQEQQHIQVRSSSRFGIGDMGANKQRVERLRQAIQENQ